MAGQRRQRPDPGRKPAGSRGMRALNPIKTPTRSRTRNAALAFLGLGIVLTVLGLTLDSAYLRPAVLLAILALVWGFRALTMR
jgi:hypothetical protein